MILLAQLVLLLLLLFSVCESSQARDQTGATAVTTLDP